MPILVLRSVWADGDLYMLQKLTGLWKLRRWISSHEESIQGQDHFRPRDNVCRGMQLRIVKSVKSKCEVWKLSAAIFHFLQYGKNNRFIYSSTKFDWIRSNFIWANLVMSLRSFIYLCASLYRSESKIADKFGINVTKERLVAISKTLLPSLRRYSGVRSTNVLKTSYHKNHCIDYSQSHVKEVNCNLIEFNLYF